MLEKKEMVQKSFRIDSKLDRALTELATIVNRSQNELIDYALRRLIKDNEVWYSNEFVKKYYDIIFESFYSPFEERFLSFQLLFIPYDHATETGGNLVLKDLDNENAIIEEYHIGNSPQSEYLLKESLSKMIKIMMKKHPELKEKYNVKEIDV